MHSVDPMTHLKKKKEKKEVILNLLNWTPWIYINDNFFTVMDIDREGIF